MLLNKAPQREIVKDLFISLSIVHNFNKPLQYQTMSKNCGGMR